MVDETKGTEAAEESQEEKTSEEEIEGEEGEEEDKPESDDGDDKDKSASRRSAIAQKKHWREKAKQASSKAEELEKELATLREAVKKPTDEKEKAAQDYIRSQAREVYKELQLERQKTEAKELSEFEAKVQEVLDDNPDVAEEELLDIIEEDEVEPKTALKILKRIHSKEDVKEKKPRMPAPRKAAGGERKEAPDDKDKSMWDILKEETNKALGK